MSNDLISRSAVMDYLREQQANVIIEKNKNGIVPVDVCEGMRLAIEACMNFIVQVPVAYDTNALVEQLEEQVLLIKEQLLDVSEEDEEAVRLRCRMRGLDEAIEIVKTEMKG